MTEAENQETRESPALGAQEEVEFSREDVESIGDPAAAGTDSEATPVGGEPPEGSPAAAQARAEGGESPLDRPEVQILGAFVGAFILAKLLQRLFGRD
ncbi:MAG: hypothetical protein M3340_10630 [Actinomycetota bacterium]|nr:hypothetical protein [Actinomycetota bacterium]